jgi:hypothetical protein
MRSIREQEIAIIVLNLVSKEFVRRICPETSIFRKEFRTEDYIDYVNTHLFLYLDELKGEEKKYASKIVREYVEDLQKIYVDSRR